MKDISYRSEIRVYYNFGSVYSTHLEADTKEELHQKIKKFVEDYGEIGKAEVIEVDAARKTTVEQVGVDAVYKLVEKVTNAYILHRFK